MKRRALIGCCAGLLTLMCFEAMAQHRKRVPRFEDYPVTGIHEGKTAPLVLDNEEQRSAITYYQAIADGGTNFAGHYAVIPLTCGESCSQAEYLDVRTGRIIAGEFSNSGWRQINDRFRDVEFRRASRLIVFAGMIDEKPPNGWHFYLFDNGKLKRLHTIVTRGDFRKPLSDLMK